MKHPAKLLGFAIPAALCVLGCVQPTANNGAGGSTGAGGGEAGATGSGGSTAPAGTGGSVSGGGGGTVGGTGGHGTGGVSGQGQGGNGQGGATGVGGQTASADGGTRPDLTGRKALFIVDNPSSLDDGDVLIQQLLEVRGMTVTYGTVVGPASLATGYQLVVGSSGASAADFATVFKAVAVPMVLFGNSYDAPMGLIATASSSKGNADSTAQIAIADASTSLSAGMAVGTMMAVINSAIVNTQFTWGTPGPAAIKVATVAGAPTEAVIFAYEKGAAMVTGTAAARRVAIGWKANAVKGLFIPPFQLQDAAFSWTAGAP